MLHKVENLLLQKINFLTDSLLYDSHNLTPISLSLMLWVRGMSFVYSSLEVEELHLGY